MAKQAIDIGSTANDGTGSSLRAAGDLVNDNFNEIYTTFGDGSTLTPFTTGTSTLTNKTLNLTNNTLSGTTAQFNTALSDDDFATLTNSVTLTNKTINLSNNTLSGTVAQFNTAVSDDDFASLTGTETLSNKTLTSVGGTISRTGDLLFDVSGDIFLDANGKDIIFRYGGTQFGLFTFHSGGNLLIQSGTTTNLTMTGANSAFAGNVDVAGNLVLTGNLTVNGSTTTVNSTNTTIDDNLLELNSGATSNANDTGIIMERGSTGDNAIVAWDESEDKFIMGTTTATASDTGNLSVTTGTLVANIEGNVTGNVTGSSGSTTGNAATATALATGRTIGMTGDVVWTSASFDGSGNVTGVAALQANTVTSTELASAVQLDIIDSSGSVQKTLYGAGS